MGVVGGARTVLLKITQSSSNQEVITWFGLAWVVKLEASKLEKYVLLGGLARAGSRHINESSY